MTDCIKCFSIWAILKNVVFIVVCVVLLCFAASAKAITWTTLDYPGVNGTCITGMDGNIIVGRWKGAMNNRSFSYDGTTWAEFSFPGSSGTRVEGIVGGKIFGSYSVPDLPTHGFVYDGTSWTTLDFPGASSTSIYDIDGGNIVGNKNTSGGFLYDGTTWTTLNCPYGGLSIYGIDGDNLVGSAGFDHSVIYNLESKAWTIFDFPEASSTIAYDIDGSNIVGYYYVSGFEHGFIYDGTAWATLDFPGASYTRIYGIEGDNIFGKYEDSSGDGHGFIATIPEPCTVLLLGLGGVLLRNRRANKKF